MDEEERGHGGGLLVFGQDRVDVVLDYLAGWRMRDVHTREARL